MDQLTTYVLLFGIIVIIGQIFHRSSYPISLLLVVTGMFLSFVPGFPRVTLNSALVLNVFLPLLVYQISSFSSWQDFKKNLRPIALLSVGHIIFIMFVVAIVAHAIIPELGWPLAFVLGAAIAPPDDVAIVSIAEKIRMPERIVTILEGEGMLNDAIALILFRVALAAVITHQFFIAKSILAFFIMVIGEAIYGFIIGFVVGEIRMKIRDKKLHIIVSLLTPFLAYLPAVELGGSGVIATVVTGFVIGHIYSVRFSPEFRLISRAVWPMISFIIQSFIFLLVGLDLRFILERISSITLGSLVLYSSAVVLAIIIGRFIWVFLAVLFLPRALFPTIRKKDPYPHWQYPFLLSWAGMRGGISLAAAFAIPFLPGMVEGANVRDLLIFLVFCAIAVTFVLQGLTLPWLLKRLGMYKRGLCEQYQEHLVELNARIKLIKAALRWLKVYQEEIMDDPNLLAEVKLYIREYNMQKKQLVERIKQHEGALDHDEQAELKTEIFLLSQLINIERAELLKLWRAGKINLTVRNKLLERLDHRARHLE